MTSRDRVQAAQTARQKHLLRGLFRKQVLAIPPARRRAASRRIAERLSRMPLFRDAQTVGVYLSLPHEVDTAPLLDLCRRARKTVAVPVVSPEDRGLAFSLVEGRPHWSRNVYGIPEPSPADLRIVDSRYIELLLLPGRAFTPGGLRLGTGAGYYDRFLALHPRLAAVGLAFDEQVTDSLPRAPHDVPADAVVTPTRTCLP